MKGFILAAGFGQRLRPITESVPKPLLPVGNVPLIVYSIRLLVKHGIRDIVINLHHLGRDLSRALGDGERFGARLIYSHETEILGTGGGVKRMHEALADDTFVVVNSDTVMALDLAAVIDTHQRHKALATMVLRRDEQQEAFGEIEVDASGRIQGILGRHRPMEVAPKLRSLMFAGVHVLEPRFLDYLPLDVSSCIVRYGYSKALDNDEPLWAYEMDGLWSDAGTPARYAEINRRALAGELRLPHVDALSSESGAPLRELSPCVWIDSDVDLGKNVSLTAPVLLGSGARVATQARLGPNVIVGPGAVVGRGAELRDTVVLSKARVASGEKLGGLLVGKKSRLVLDDASAALEVAPEPPRVGP